MITRALACLALATLPVATHAEVTAVGAGGFHLKLERTVAATPEATWQALLVIGRWWDDAHTYSGKAANMTLDARAGGCFCERFDGTEVEHMRVAHVAPATKQLVMIGGLGPLLWQGAQGSLVIALKAVDGGTQLKWEYRVAGFEPAGWEATAPLVDKVLAQQLERLDRLVSTGP